MEEERLERVGLGGRRGPLVVQSGAREMVVRKSLKIRTEPREAVRSQEGGGMTVSERRIQARNTQKRMKS